MDEVCRDEALDGSWLAEGMLSRTGTLDGIGKTGGGSDDSDM